jgi:hypothetical protein
MNKAIKEAKKLLKQGKLKELSLLINLSTYEQAEAIKKAIYIN